MMIFCFLGGLVKGPIRAGKALDAVHLLLNALLTEPPNFPGEVSALVHKGYADLQAQAVLKT